MQSGLCFYGNGHLFSTICCVSTWPSSRILTFQLHFNIMLSKYCVGKIVIAFLWSFSLIVEGKSDLGTCPTGQHEEHQSGEIK